MKPNFLYAFDKVVKTIKSCEDLNQLEVAENLLDSFERMFAKEICDKTKQIYFTTLDDLRFEMTNKICYNLKNALNQ
jgi:hypothetical protein